MASGDRSRNIANDLSEMRLDRWLWAARFFKTRGLAAEAVTGGLVHLNDARTKPAKPARVGDRVSVQRGELTTVVRVLGLSEQRRPAPEATALYEETSESAAARALWLERRRAETA